MAKLGDKAKDTITGFKGIVIAKTEWLYGCSRITIQPQELDKDGKPVECRGFDEPQIEVLEVGAHHVAPKLRKTGGPRDEPTRHSDPVRSTA